MVEKMIKNVLLGILGFILLLTLVGAAAPTLITALNNVAGSGLPLERSTAKTVIPKYKSILLNRYCGYDLHFWSDHRSDSPCFQGEI